MILIKALAVVVGLYAVYAYLLRFDCRILERLSLRGDGSWGVLWPLVSVARALLKPSLSPPGAWQPAYIAAPLCVLSAALLSLMLVPGGLATVVAGSDLLVHFKGLDIGLPIVLGIGWLGLLGTLLGAWSFRLAAIWERGRRLFGLDLGYSLAAAFSLLTVAFLLRSPGLVAIVHVQSQLPLVLYQPLGFAICALALVAGSPRLPYALPDEVDTPLAHWQLGHAGSAFALYQMAEYVQILFSGALLTTVYLAGGAGPWSSGPHWLLLKTLLLSAVLLWLRARWLAGRRRQLQHRGWLMLCALAVFNGLLTALSAGL